MTKLNQYQWQIGRLIVDHEQQGNVRAAYGKQQLQELYDGLAASFGKGFDVTNLRNMRRFYSAFPIRNAVRSEYEWITRTITDEQHANPQQPKAGLLRIMTI